MTKGSADWDQRFAEAGYAYGQEPNAFLQQALQGIPCRGEALSLCEGEGRNAVYLARLGFTVTAVDFSPVGRDKALALADQAGVRLDYRVMDLADWVMEPQRWQLVVAIFSQPDSSTRQRLYGQLHQALLAGGHFVLESKVDPQAGVQDRYPGVNILKGEIAPMSILLADEQEQEMSEGRYHLGRMRTAKLLAVKA